MNQLSIQLKLLPCVIFSLILIIVSRYPRSSVGSLTSHWISSRRVKGVVYCKACKRYYQAKELKRVVVGHGESPFSVDVRGRGWLRKLFGKKQRLPLFGGRGYQCPEGHELIGLVTWRT